MTTAHLLDAALIGAGATLCMDLWALFLRRAFGIRSLDYRLLGRWVLHMAEGRFRHESIAAAHTKRHECAVGWTAHYSIGVAFALAFALIAPGWLERPTLLPALAFGVVTVVIPLFTLQPAFGLGVAASKTPRPSAARLKSLMTHTVFGLGLYLSAYLGARFAPPWAHFAGTTCAACSVKICTPSTLRARTRSGSSRLAPGPRRRDRRPGLGAHEFVDTKKVAAAEGLQKLGGADVVLATAPHSSAIASTFDGLKARGKLLLVAAPHEPLTINPFGLLSGKTIAGWPSGSAIDSEETMAFSTLAGVRPRIEKFPLAKAEDAFAHMMANKVRFRAVLVP